MYNNKMWFTSICLFITSLFSCQQKGGNFETVSVDTFAEVISDPSVQRLDVRTVAEYSEGHIPGSLNINVLDDEHFAQISDSALDRNRPVALYCRSGKRSKKAAQILSGKGFKVYELGSGFNGWKEAGQAVEK